MDYSRAKEE